MYLTLLFNTAERLCAWVPVWYGMEVVIVSIPFLRWVIEHYSPLMHSSSGQDVDVRELLMTQFQGETEKVDVDVKSRKFQNAILRTPFKPSKFDGDFFVVKADAWKMFLTEIIASGCAANKFECSQFQLMSIERIAGSNISFMPGKSNISCWNKKITEKQKKYIPGFRFPWWNELFTASVRKFFDIRGEAKHVVRFEPKGGKACVDVQQKVLTFVEAKEEIV